MDALPRFPAIDTHADSLGDVLAGRRRLMDRSDAGQLDFPRMREGGIRIQFLSCWVESAYKPERSLGRLLSYIEQFWEELESAGPYVLPVTDADSLARAWRGDALGAVLSVEGAEAVGQDLGRIRLLHRLGVRLMSLTWNQRNQFGDGAGEDPGGSGLSRLGREAVRTMNRVGIVPDVSHLAEAGFWDVLSISAVPPIASHSNCRSLARVPRNLSNAQVRALAGRGGIQGVTFVPEFLGAKPDVERVVDHMWHALQLVGHDRCLGLGSDFDGGVEPVPGVEDASRLPQLAEAMLRRGISEESVRRIFGENYKEYFGRVWTSPAAETFGLGNAR